MLFQPLLASASLASCHCSTALLLQSRSEAGKRSHSRASLPSRGFASFPFFDEACPVGGASCGQAAARCLMMFTRTSCTCIRQTGAAHARAVVHRATRRGYVLDPFMPSTSIGVDDVRRAGVLPALRLCARLCCFSQALDREGDQAQEHQAKPPDRRLEGSSFEGRFTQGAMMLNSV